MVIDKCDENFKSAVPRVSPTQEQTLASFIQAECAAPDGGASAICYETNVDTFIHKVGALLCSSGG